jgi:thymidylate synthase
MEQLRTNPDDRGIIVNSWNIAELHQMALRPCHVMMQFQSYKNEEGKRVLNLMMTQRSADVFLGVPYNIACYSLLLHMVAQIQGMIPGDFIHSMGDTHIYKNHIEQSVEVIERWYKGKHHRLPKLKLNKNITDIDDFRSEHIELVGYKSHPFIPAKVAV